VLRRAEADLVGAERRGARVSITALVLDEDAHGSGSFVRVEWESTMHELCP
jgi:hypothetical protein